MKKLLFIGMLGLAACHTDEGTAPSLPTPAQDTTIKVYPASLLDNKKDPVCGMPAGSGLEDTIHYNGKVIGFCSDVCRDDFLKNPKAYAIEYK